MNNSAQFQRELTGWVMETKKREEELFRRVDRHVEMSILDGSPVTGAPGQPWRTGRLYRGWRRRGSIAARRISYVNNVPYAPIIEDNLRGATLRSKRGGFHSVKKTRAGFKRIVAHELAAVKGTAVEFRGGAWRDVATGRFASAPT